MSKNDSGDGIGLCGAVFIVFLTLKLCNAIDWSWWWVTAPLWMPFALVLVVVMLAAIFMSFAGMFDYMPAKPCGTRANRPSLLKKIKPKTWGWIGGIAFCALLGIVAYFLPPIM